MFHELERSDAFRFSFWADTEGTESVLTAGQGDLKEFVRLRNHSHGNWVWQSGLISNLLRSRPDVVIFVGSAYYLSTWIAALLARALNRPVLFWTQGWLAEETGLKRLVRVSFYRLADRLLLYGHRAADIGVKMGFPRERMTVVYNSVGRPRREAVGKSETSSRPGSSTEVILVSRLIKERGVEVLLQAARLLDAQGSRTTINLIGDGPEEERLKKLASDLGVDAKFHGPIYDQKLLDEAYERADVCVLPGRAGLAVIQSLLARVPVVAHSNLDDHMPEVEAIMPGVTGEFFTKDDPADLARAILQCIERKNDPRVVDVREKALDTVTRLYTPEHQAQVVERVCREVGSA
ncbi:glycosyltransferase family 4 protein [Actinopolymorpha cephalotaxi]|uniref:Glycosyltransferase involved in cell wall biosynthesis n=1 Tax=Actinopolymorpha cephalotaxi TaxID=504797 RepID=A0ABX2S7H5_9ACTN|nr:glycosyltransferase family 4 protein [Actinopolymorpha cephalotaxi]NYH84973.1 glycosyltransferase involved in cell wall biosynthesis [Actinopolymorpha cephalotaxi]